MKFLYISVFALAICGFHRSAMAEDVKEEVKTEMLDDRAMAEEAANPDALQDAESLDQQSWWDDADVTADVGDANVNDANDLNTLHPRHPGNRPGHPGWHRPGRGHGRDWDRRHPRFPRIFYRTCFAKNAAGHVFRASGTVFSTVNLQRRAMVACRINSRFPGCRALGCR